jgi:hypothetical protein
MILFIKCTNNQNVKPSYEIFTDKSQNIFVKNTTRRTSFLWFIWLSRARQAKTFLGSFGGAKEMNINLYL